MSMLAKMTMRMKTTKMKKKMKKKLKNAATRLRVKKKLRVMGLFLRTGGQTVWIDLFVFCVYMNGV